MRIQHFFENGQEVVIVDDSATYIVDRKQEQLRRVTPTAKVLSLEQRQFGKTGTGDLELLERYCSDDGESVVVDSSPSWLEEIGVE